MRFQTAEWGGQLFKKIFSVFVCMSTCVCECSHLYMHGQVVVSHPVWAACTLKPWATSSTPTRTLEKGHLFFPPSQPPFLSSLHFSFPFRLPFIVLRQSYTVHQADFELTISQNSTTIYLACRPENRESSQHHFTSFLLLWDSLTLQLRLASDSKPPPPSECWDNRTSLPPLHLTMHFT